MRLIDADAMREDWLNNGQNEYVYDTNAVLESIDEQPTIEAEPVVHGEWTTIYFSYWSCKPDGVHPVMRKERKKYRHDECGKVVSKREPYCPNCGARMDKEENDGNEI